MTTTNEISEAYSFLSDMYKDAYGFRPRNYRNDLTLAEIQEEIDDLYEIVKENMAQEEIRLQEDIKAFKKLISDTILIGAEDYETAVNWLFDSFKPEDGVITDLFNIESFLYFYGIMHSDLGRDVQKILIKLNV
jgi:hypothetical protein